MSSATTDCVTWGALSEGLTVHHDCVVVVTRENAYSVIPEQAAKLALPAVCRCECRVCMRAWWDKNRPARREDGSVVDRDGRILVKAGEA